MLVFSLLMPLSIVVRFKHNLYSTLLLDLPFFVTATFSVCFFYVATQRELGMSWGRRLKYLPFLLSLGIGLAINKREGRARGAAQPGVRLHAHSEDRLRGQEREGGQKSYRGKKNWLPIVELAFGVYFTGAIWLAWHLEVYASLPFLVRFQWGFLYVGASSLLQDRFAKTEPPQAQQFGSEAAV